MTAFIAKGKEGPKGSTGDVGPSGLSAYQIALNQGFIGTEAAWLASLIGTILLSGPLARLQFSGLFLIFAGTNSFDSGTAYVAYR